jgi:glycine cleavage system aminomethyltransferase T
MKSQYPALVIGVEQRFGFVTSGAYGHTVGAGFASGYGDREAAVRAKRWMCTSSA